jgi:uncharacterized membrane protein YfcA
MNSLGSFALVGLAGFIAGAMNTVAGAGTLITFPLLLSLGVPPVAANVTSAVGLLSGSISGAIGYRRELAGQRDRLLRLGLASILGGVSGAVLLIVLSPGVFKAVVPALIALAVLMVVLQPHLSRRVVAVDHPHPVGAHPLLLWMLILLAGVYGGYFGAAQGVLLVAVLAVLLDTNLQRVNGMKNVLAVLVNSVAALMFAFLAHPNWRYVAIIAVCSAFGGQAGAAIGRRLSPEVLRGVIVIAGLAALVEIALST